MVKMWSQRNAFKSTLVGSVAVHYKVAVNSGFIIVTRGLGLIYVLLYSTWFLTSFAITLSRKGEKDGCFTLIVFLMACDC